MKHLFLISVVISTCAITGGQELPAQPPAGESSLAKAAPVETVEQLRELIGSIPPPAEVDWKLLSSAEFSSHPQIWKFSPDGAGIVLGEHDGTITVIRVEDGAKIGQFKVAGKIQSLALTTDLRYVAVGDEKAVVYTTADGQVAFTHKNYQGDVNFLAVSPDGTRLLGADKTGTVYQYPLLGGQGNYSSVDPEKKPLKAIAASPDLSQVMYTLASDYSLYCNLSKAVNERLAADNLNGHIDKAKAIAMGDSIFLVETDKGFTHVSPGREGESFEVQLRNFDVVGISSFAVSPSDDRMLLVTREGQIQLLDSRLTNVSVVSQPPMTFGMTVLEGHGALAAPDCRTIALKRSSRVFFQRIANDPLERLTKISRLTSSLLAEGRHPLLAECERLTDASPAQLSENEFFEAIRPHSDISRIPERVEELKNWLSADSDSVFPRIVLADYSYHVAWRHRGSGFVGTVTDEGASKFEEHIKEASAYLEGFVPGPETPDRYFELQFRLHTSSGASREEFDATVDQTLQYCPRNLTVHEAATAYLMPRWLGNPGDVAEYVDRVIAVVGDEEGGKIQMSVIQMQLPYYRESDFFEATGFQYAPLKTLLDEQLADKNRTTEQRDEVIGVYAGLARRAEDLVAVEAMVSEVMTGGWLARNKHHRRAYSDVGRTLNWLREKKGEAAIYQGIFDKIPLPKPGEDWPRPRLKTQPPSESPPPKGADSDPSSPPR